MTEAIHDIYIPKFKLIYIVIHNSCHNSLQYLHPCKHPVQTLILNKIGNFVSLTY